MDTNSPVITVIQAHHFECGEEDDYILIKHSAEVSSYDVYQDFLKVLQASESEADDCRCTWLDIAISAMKDKYIDAGYIEKAPFYIDLSFGMFSDYTVAGSELIHV